MQYYEDCSLRVWTVYNSGGLAQFHGTPNPGSNSMLGRSSACSWNASDLKVLSEAKTINVCCLEPMSEEFERAKRRRLIISLEIIVTETLECVRHALIKIENGSKMVLTNILASVVVRPLRNGWNVL